MTGTERTIAFMDLSRFTSLNDVHGDTTAVDVLDRFLACVEASLDGGARVVKTLGDGVLLEAPDPDVGVRVAARIIERFHDEAGMPDVSGGLHHGPVVAREGDILGATVNLASRLADAAPASELYTTAEPARAASRAGLRVEPLGPTVVRGLRDPVDVFAVAPCDHNAPDVRTDPVCGMRITPGPNTTHLEIGERTEWFCSSGCADKFAADADRYLRS
jgi:adenylate cyclase